MFYTEMYFKLLENKRNISNILKTYVKIMYFTHFLLFK